MTLAEAFIIAHGKDIVKKDSTNYLFYYKNVFCRGIISENPLDEVLSIYPVHANDNIGKGAGLPIIEWFAKVNL